eukprot:6196513-Pleurochrysis_carterae.AAC.2
MSAALRLPRTCLKGEGRQLACRSVRVSAIVPVPWRAQDPKLLKESIKRMYQKHVTETVSTHAMENDIAAEYTRQRE